MDVKHYAVVILQIWIHDAWFRLAANFAICKWVRLRRLLWTLAMWVIKCGHLLHVNQCNGASWQQYGGPWCKAMDAGKPTYCNMLVRGLDVATVHVRARDAILQHKA